MKVFVSSLIRDISHMEEVAGWVNGLGDPDIGVELIAFTHDDGYWNTLRGVLKALRCPVTFHGPYIGTEGTSERGGEGWRQLMESYRRVFSLAGEYGVRHVVYHTTQRGFSPGEVDAMRAAADANAAEVMDMAERAGVEVLIENLAYPSGDRLPLYTNAQFCEFFEAHPHAGCIIDVGHAHINGLDLAGFLRRFGSHTKAYHFHNNDGARDQHNDLFHGTFSYGDFAPVYRRYTPCADIVLEYEPHVGLDNRALYAQIEYVLTRFGG